MELINNLNDDLIKKTTTTTGGYDYQYNFIEILQKYFTKFLNNRIGSKLKESEVLNIKSLDKTPFKRGEIVIYEISYNDYRVVMFLKELNDNESECFDMESNGLISIVNIYTDLLYHYSQNETLKQELKEGVTLSSENILETYHV